MTTTPEIRTNPAKWDHQYVTDFMHLLCSEQPDMVNPTELHSCKYQLDGKRCLVGEFLHRHDLLDNLLIDENPSAADLHDYVAGLSERVADDLDRWQRAADNGGMPRAWGEAAEVVDDGDV